MARRIPKTVVKLGPVPEPRCSICNKGTSHLFNGVRFCATHHPARDEHVTDSTLARSAA